MQWCIFLHIFFIYKYTYLISKWSNFFYQRFLFDVDVFLTISWRYLFTYLLSISWLSITVHSPAEYDDAAVYNVLSNVLLL